MIADRIHRARVASGLSLRDVAGKLGISHTAVAKYEAGEVTPTSKILLGFSQALGVRVEFFFRPDDISLSGVEYRKRSTLGKRAQARIEASVLERAERCLELVGLFPEPPFPAFSVPEVISAALAQLSEIEGVAVALRDAWHLGYGPIADLTGTLEEKGILVQTVDEDFDGLSGTLNGIPLVVVGARWPGERQRFTISHELGHLVLHGHLDDALDEEKACNRFAGAFIAPAPSVIAALGPRRQFVEPREIYTLKHEFGLSMSGWVFRARDLGVLSEAGAEHLFRMFSMNGWRKREPGAPIPSERPSLFEQLVLRALAEGWVGESKAAELMGEPQSEFRARRLMDGSSETPH